MVLLYILLHILFAPVDERVHLNQVVNVVPFHYLHILAGYALLLSQSADPYVESLHRPLQRFQLSYLAAAVSAFYRIIEEVDALFLHHLLHRLVVREEYFQVDAVGHVCLVDELVGFRKESAGIECEDAGRFIYLHDDVGKRLVLDAEGRRKSDAPFECLQEITDNILGRRIAEFLIEFRNERLELLLFFNVLYLIHNIFLLARIIFCLIIFFGTDYTDYTDFSFHLKQRNHKFSV